MADHPRSRKMAERIQVIVAQMLDTKVKDPRLGFVTVTDTVFGDEEDRTNTAVALDSAKGLIRSEVGKQVGTRLTPTIEFFLDSVPENAANFERALHEAHRRDTELEAIRKGATYAGDADPYRTDEPVDDESASEE